MRVAIFSIAALATSAHAALHKRQEVDITMPVVSLPVVSSTLPEDTSGADVSLPVVSSTLPQESTDVGGGGGGITLPVESSSIILGPTNTTIPTTTMTTTSLDTSSSDVSTVTTEITTTDSEGADVTITSTAVVGPSTTEGEDAGTTSIEPTSDPDGAAPTNFVGNAAAGLVALAGIAAIL